MKLLKILSRTGNFILLFCFFLPFAPVGCGAPSAAEIAYKVKNDSIYRADSVQRHRISTPSDASELADSIARALSPEIKVVEKKTELATPDPFWKVVLSRLALPGNSITGFGIILLMTGAMFEKTQEIWPTLFLMTPLGLSFLLTIFSAFYGLTKNAFIKRVLPVSSLSGFICFQAFFFVLNPKDTLYGFWLTLSVWLLNLILMRFVSRNEKNNNLNPADR